MTHGWSHSHQVPRFQTLCWQNWHLHSQAWLPLNTLMSLGKKKKREKQTSCLTPESRQRVFCHPPQSIPGILPHFLSHPILPSRGAWTNPPKPCPHVSFPSLPWWRADPQPARRAEGVDMGSNCPYSDTVN